MLRNQTQLPQCRARGVVLGADGVAHLLQELFWGVPGFSSSLTEAGESVILLGKMVRRAIFKPDAFLIPSHLILQRRIISLQ